MNPELHKMLRNELSADGVLTGRKKAMLQRMRSKFSRDNDDEMYDWLLRYIKHNIILCSLIDINARRPSLRTDLLLNRAKTVGLLHLSRTPSIGGNSSGATTTSSIVKNGSVKAESKSKKSIVSQPAAESPPQHSPDTHKLIRQIRNNCVISWQLLLKFNTYSYDLWT